MKLSPLQLEAYFLTELSLRANQDFDPGKPTVFKETDIVVTPDMQAVKDHNRRWQVTLNLKLQPRPDSNSPYLLALNLAGVIWAAAELPEDKVVALVRTNGPSMLFGVAREIVRDLTARGPFPQLLLPSVSFLPEPPAAAPPTSTAVEPIDAQSNQTVIESPAAGPSASQRE